MQINDLQSSFEKKIIVVLIIAYFTGCVERGNGDLQVKLGKWMDSNGENWSKGLQFVVHAINTSEFATTRKTPFEVVFGQKPRSHCAVLDELSSQGIVNEEDLPDGLLQEPEPEPSSSDPDPEPNNGDGGEDSAVKYGRNFILMSGRQLVAAGKECKSLTTVHGYEVNLDTHAIVCVDSVMTSEFVPTVYNPSKEALAAGQFFVWSRDDLVEDEDDDVPQKRIRLEAR